MEKSKSIVRLIGLEGDNYMLAFITTEFLKNKLNELKNINASELIIYQLEKEIALLDKLDIETVDMRGTPDEFEQKIRSNELVFLPKGEWNEILKERNIYNKCKQLFNE
jgi:hypothetical protein